ncbi:MAG: twin-arginine translocase TatA/TatE family subunit [Ignavibacteriae bacterium]|nr:MAG: twin-arginine translocase TatA/TatE family subunit [Ignavibacteriota bacterium]
MGNIGVLEIILIVVIIVLLFGGKKIPGIAKALGDGIREIRKSTNPAGSDDAPESKKPDGNKKS